MEPTPAKFPATAAGLLLLITAQLHAAQEPDQFPISVEEMQAHRAALFAQIDSNGDGLISPEEFAAFRPARDFRGGHGRHAPDVPGHRPAGPGGTGRDFSPERKATIESQLFDALDTDGDGVISRAEFSTEALAAARREIMQAYAFERLDKNQDGMLSPDEFPPRHPEALDTNQDGEISREEYGAQRRGRDAS